MRFSHGMLRSLTIAIALPIVAGAALGDEPPKTAEQAVAAWNAAEQQITQIEQRLEQIQAQFQQANQQEQEKLRNEAIPLVDRIKNHFRTIGEAMPLAYSVKAKGAGEDAEVHQLAQQALGLAFEENRYDDAAKIADAILAVRPNDAAALNVGGVAQFATHQFQKAVEMFEKAKQANALIPQLGGNYVDSARNYVQYWEKEQAIRQKEAAATGDQQLPRVRLTTGKGDVVLELFENEAPNTVANFISLVEKGFYNGSGFHRVIPNFMAQGGMPGKKFGGLDGPGYTIKCECYRPDARRHFAGTLSMAHAGKDTGGSQFFITHLPTPHLDKEVRPESVHTVFGRVVEGMDVVAAIEQGDPIVSAEVIRKRNHPYQPETQPDR